MKSYDSRYFLVSAAVIAALFMQPNTAEAAKPVPAPPTPTIINLMPSGSGNSPANIANHGAIVWKGNSIYFLKRAPELIGEHEETIFSARKDGANSVEIVDDEAWDLNLLGDWLYYSNWSDGHSLYRLKLDGSDRTKVLDDSVHSVNLVAGNRVVYIRWKATSNKENNIFVAPADGGSPVRICDDQVENVGVWGEWAYYANGSDGYKPYKVKLDGTGRVKISDDETLFMIVAGDWIYYNNYSDGEKLYRIGTDGKNRMLVSADRTGFINVSGDWIYYTNSSDKDALYRIRSDGSQRKKIADSDAGAQPISVTPDSVYFNQKIISK